MKLKVDLKTQEVEEVNGEFAELPGVTNNGQHYQLRGHVLAEYNAGDYTITLLHPDTNETTGHFDAQVCYRCSEPTFHMYAHNAQFDYATDLYVWPTGGWSLLLTVLVIETYLNKRIGFRPVLKDLLISSQRPKCV